MKMSKRLRLILITVLAFMAIPVVIIYTSYAATNQPQPEQDDTAAIVPKVTVSPISSGRFQGVVEVYGEVRAMDEASFSSQVTGRVVWRNPKFVEGGRVNKGDVLARLDNTDYRTALAMAGQSLAEAEMALLQEKSKHQQALRDWQHAGLPGDPDKLVLREPQLNVAKMRYKAAETALAQAERDLAQTQLKAPFSAVILSRSVAEGSYVEPGSEVAKLRASKRAEISLALSAGEWQLLPSSANGHVVQIKSQDQAGVHWQGKIERLSQTVDQRTRQRTLVVTVDEPLDLTTPLLFGSFVSVEINGEEVADPFALPVGALTVDGYVWFVEDGQLQRYRTKPVFSHHRQVFIPRGDLPEQIDLVRKPLASYSAGMKVKPTIFEAAL